MNHWIKAIRLIVCIVLLAALCACSAGEPSGAETGQSGQEEELAQLNQQISSLEAQIVVLEEELAQSQSAEGSGGGNEAGFVDVEGLLNRISGSGKTLEPFPAMVTGGYISEAGCVLHIDRLEYNPDFTPGSDSGGTYLLNPEELEEEIDASSAYAQFDARVTGEVSYDFMDYLASLGGQGQFTLYMLGDELVLVSEILVP